MLADIQKQITNSKPKMKQNEIVQICLDYITYHPEDINVVGIAWYDNCKFIINTKIFSSFTKRKINTINRNFRQNGFKCYKTNAAMRERKIGSITYNQLLDPKNWVIHYTDKIKLKQPSIINQNALNSPTNEIQIKSKKTQKFNTLDFLLNLSDESHDVDYFEDYYEYL